MLAPYLFSTAPFGHRVSNRRRASIGDAASIGTAAPIGTAARGRRAALRVLAGSNTIRLAVRPASRSRAATVLRRLGARFRVQRSRGRVAFLIANPRGLTSDEHPFAGELPRALERAGVATIALRTP